MAYNVFFFLGHFFIRPKIRQEKAGHKYKVNRFAIIVPAHNEEKLIGKLIASISNIDYPQDKVEGVIVADNCTDHTAEIAINSGVKCLVRNDQVHRGKPYALDWALKQLDLEAYDAYVIVDADTMIGRAFLLAMNDRLNNGAEAIQGYFNIMNPDDSWLTRIAVVPGILKFRMRYAVKERLKLSCPLMGNGMCFSRNIIKQYGWNAFSITENWEYYIMLTLGGYAVGYDGDAVIYSHAVIALSHGETQRKRWLRGQLGVLLSYYRPLLKMTVRGKSLIALDALIELLLPSYSILLSWSIGILAILLVLSLFDAQFVFLRNWSALIVFAQLVYCLYGFVLSKPTFKTWMSLSYLPVFLIWKLAVTMKGFLGLKKKEWEKTERHL